MKILILHGYSNQYGFDSIRLTKWIERLNGYGFYVDDYVCPLAIKGMRMPWHKLNYTWQSSDRILIEFYEKLANKCNEYDVLINFGAINLHPNFLEQLSIIKVLVFRDDPESTKYFSEPVALFHDICAIGNIAEINKYKSWGHKYVTWLPNGFWEDDFDSNLKIDELFSIERDVDVSILCERLTQYRKRNLDKFTKAFPKGEYYGKGWPNGFLPEMDRVKLIQRSKIGINIHNSTGPINFRTFYLPANGVLQICDNKSYLGKIFELDKEVIGYNNIEEAIEKTNYYLNNETERLKIARAGFIRTMKDYNEKECFNRIIEAVNLFKLDHIKQAEKSHLVTISNSKKNKIEVLFKFIRMLAEDLRFKTDNFVKHKLPRLFGKYLK